MSNSCDNDGPGYLEISVEELRQTTSTPITYSPGYTEEILVLSNSESSLNTSDNLSETTSALKVSKHLITIS